MTLSPEYQALVQPFIDSCVHAGPGPAAAQLSAFIQGDDDLKTSILLTWAVAKSAEIAAAREQVSRQLQLINELQAAVTKALLIRGENHGP